ncbi:VOC family protein [Desulfofustis limnaeus]|jgi:methylmalonyl-CoA/ethylmalonyl-CoA epimerase|uniref:Methylmalonyl-CoA epimerase n=1 Tax=Desulfofustis limnaeus TaxID=2740163 RepID=A0ABN6M6E1_9BACT|nr:VOC family protein [Desulfofustis limnaeus]BDD87624.1 methylmalonyl-CoA epimerase [Desulfofustis limnaeus]
MKIDHVGIVVGSMAKAIDQWQTYFGYRQATEPVLNTRQKVVVVFLEKPGSLPVKLVEPTGPDSPVAAFARRGGGLHHLCFLCDELEPELDRLKQAGARVLTEPQPGEAFANEKIAFLFAGQGLNIELIDTLTRAGRIGSQRPVED